MNNAEIMEKVRGILTEVRGDSSISDRLTDSTNIITDVGLDSIEMINFILILEDEFRIEIDFEEFSYDNLSRMDRLCQSISELMSSSAL